MIKRIYSWGTFNRVFIFGGYNDSFADYSLLVTEAKKDFTNLADNEISIGKVTESDSIKGYSLISFLIEPEQSNTPGYDKRKEFDFKY